MAESPAAPVQAAAAVPDPMSLARDRLVELGADAARGAAERRIRRFVKGYVPKVFHPLIPGEGGSVVANARAAVQKWFWGLVTSAIISAVFFAIFAVAIVGFALVTIYAVVSSM